MALQARLQWESKERQILAPYAQYSSESRGRHHAEPVHVFRSEYQRDRDRIIHSSAFRRLEYKTQVVLNGTGDHFRTRLTHTIEVAAISRTTARALGLNEDLSEAVSLAHDLGHPPFGHPGEHTLNQLMTEHGGFEHNRQSLRVVEELEMKYPEFNGLNLSWEVREGLCKGFLEAFGDGPQPSLEAQIADAADEIAYCCNDLDDALENCLIAPEDLRDIALWSKIEEDVAQNYSKLEFSRKRRYLIRCLIDMLVEDLCRQSDANIEESGVKTASQARAQNKRLIGFSMPMRSNIQNLRDFLMQHFYYHPSVSQINQRACKVLQALVEFYHKHPHLIGQKAALRIKKDGPARAVCDYVSGMTDGYALKMYAKHIGTDNLLTELLPKS
ncbi:MAG: deoxyguanosinetriphosphate triphosphohydrolase [Methylacidiphilales bacterium]|nr:deoxyguanosinetriphosphate triphosphohydrolase [Candidatus Methylacidiphilales bacterium]